jgi:lysozyme
MKTGQAGIELIKHFEGCKLTPYICPAGVLTVGFGHTGKDIIEDKVYSADEIEVLLVSDLAKFEVSVARLIKVGLTQNQFDALVSFSFNLGAGALQSSTLRSKLNRGEYDGAADQFLRWNKSAGKVLAGLTKRRIAERDLFLS